MIYAPRWPSRLLFLAVLASMATLLGLAWLWLVRNPMLSSWDEVMHLNLSMGDALVLRSGNLAALRDALLLQDRWLPPGLRLVGLPVAALFGGDAPIALRVLAAVLTTATVLVIWAGLRPVAGRAGAAAGALLYALTPQNLLGAESFMTEIVLHLCAALAMALLLREAVASRASVWRLGLLGPVLGLGALAKLTFLPTIGLAWAGLIAWRWWRDRDPATLRLRILLPALGLAVVAWPFYLLNGGRYIGYAKATAAGYGFIPVEETGLAFVLRALGTLLWEVLGLGGAPLLLAAAVLGVLGWRRLSSGERGFILLAVLAATPAFLGFLLSKNQTERYLGISIVALAYPVGLAVGAALHDLRLAAIARGAVAVVAVAAFLQLGAAWLVALAGPIEGRPLRPMVEANWRVNLPCDLTPVTAFAPAREDRTRIGVFGLTQAINPNTIRHAFLRQGRNAQVVELVTDSATDIDWPRVMAESAQLDLVILPEVFWQHGTDPTKSPGERNVADRSIDEYREKLAAAGLVEDRGAIANGAIPECTAHALAIRGDDPMVQAARARPLRPEARD